MESRGSLGRRPLLRAGLALGLTGVAAGLAACGPAPRPIPTTPTSPGSRDGEESPPAEGTPVTTEPARVLLAYFSRAGENYWDGGRRVIDVGNTEVIADMIAAAIAVDVYRIEAADPYPFEYEPTVQRNWSEVQAEARPGIANPLPNLDGYDAILLGSPVWAMQEPMIMRTFVEGLDRLAGRAVHPFVTYAVSRFGSTLDHYAEFCPDATFTDGLAIRGEEARDSEPEVRAWLDSFGLLTP